MSQSAGRRSSSLTVLDWILLPAGAVLFHVLLFVLFIPMERDIPGDTATERFTLIVPEENIRKDHDPFRLRYCLDYMDPETLIKPDRINGFSSILDRKRLHLPSPYHCHHSLFEEKALFAGTGRQTAEVRDLDRLTVFSAGECRRKKGDSVSGTEAAAQKYMPAEVQYPIWSDHTGKIFMGYFLPDASAKSLFKQYAGKAEKATLLKVTAERGKFPLIRLLRSCGVPALDQLAQRQLSTRKKYYDLPEGISGKQDFFYQVIWKKPDLRAVLSKGDTK